MTYIPKLINPVAVDRAIYGINDALAAALPWLDWAFGRAQRITRRTANKKEYRLPNVWKGGNEYTDVSPDQCLGNFLFWFINDPQVVEVLPGRLSRIKYSCSLILWYDCRKVVDGGERNTERVKAQVLVALDSVLMPVGAKVRIEKTYDEATNIYHGFSLSEVDNQYLTHPFAGLRIDMVLAVDEDCDTGMVDNRISMAYESGFAAGRAEAIKETQGVTP